MTDFNSIVADVYTVTNRPDLVAETALAVKSATLTLHKKDFFYKDLFETALQYDTANYLQTIEYRELFPQYRSLKYLRKFDPTAATGSQVGDFFDIITPEKVLDLYANTRNDVAYVAGSVIQVRSSTEDSYALIGVYNNPVIATPETYSSWIADEDPYAIVYSAAALVFGNVLGDRTRQATNENAAMRTFIDTWNANIVAVGM